MDHVFVWDFRAVVVLAFIVILILFGLMYLGAIFLDWVILKYRQFRRKD